MRPEYYKINTSAIMILPLYNSLIPVIKNIDDSEHPHYFSVLAWDYGLINTFLNGSLYFLFKKNALRSKISECTYSLEDHIKDSIEIETMYELDEVLVLRNTLTTKWYDWIEAIKKNKLHLLDEDYIKASCILDIEVPAPTTEMGKNVVNYNLPWGVLSRFPKLVEKIQKDFKTKDIGQWPMPIFDEEKEKYGIEQLLRL